MVLVVSRQAKCRTSGTTPGISNRISKWVIVVQPQMHIFLPHKCCNNFCYNFWYIVHMICLNIFPLIYIIFDRVGTYNFQYILGRAQLSSQSKQLWKKTNLEICDQIIKKALQNLSRPQWGSKGFSFAHLLYNILGASMSWFHMSWSLFSHTTANFKKKKHLVEPICMFKLWEADDKPNIIMLTSS